MGIKAIPGHECKSRRNIGKYKKPINAFNACLKVTKLSETKF